MSRKFLLLYTIVLILATLLFAEVFRPLAPSRSYAEGDCRAFPETGKQVCGRFLEYWTGAGGLAQQGLPISNEFSEVSDLNGQTYTVQYFERAVFEKHPENARPYDVLLSQLGTFQFARKYPNGEPVGTTPPPSVLPTSTPGAPAEVEYTLYTASKGGWSIEYPSNWTVKENAPNFTFFEPSQEAFIQVTFDEGKVGSQSQEELAHSASAGFAIAFEDYEEYGFTEQNDGSYRIDFKFTVAGVAWDAQAFVEGRQGNMYILMLGTTEAAYQATTYEDVITYVISSYSVPKYVSQQDHDWVGSKLYIGSGQR